MFRRPTNSGCWFDESDVLETACSFLLGSSAVRTAAAQVLDELVMNCPNRPGLSPISSSSRSLACLLEQFRHLVVVDADDATKFTSSSNPNEADQTLFFSSVIPRSSAIEVWVASPRREGIGFWTNPGPCRRCWNLKPAVREGGVDVENEGVFRWLFCWHGCSKSQIS